MERDPLCGGHVGTNEVGGGKPPTPQALHEAPGDSCPLRQRMKMHSGALKVTRATTAPNPT